METAVNFLMDGAPLLGERVVVFGQGIVGLLTTGVAGAFSPGSLVTLDYHALRRQASLDWLALASLDPLRRMWMQLNQLLPEGADLTYELTGSPAALDQAIRLTGF